MGKAAAFVSVLALSTLLLATGKTVVESEPNGDAVEGISTPKTPKTNEDPGIKIAETPGNASAGSNGSGRSKNSNERRNQKKGERNTMEENPATNASSVIGLARTDVSRDDSVESNKSVCAAPPEIEGAITPRLGGTEHAEGTLVTYSCNFGYVSRNSINHVSVCRLDETTGKVEWTAPEITCIPRSCGDPGYLNNGRRIGNLFTFPNKVEYDCEEGYKLKGLRARYCQAGGEWSGRLPTCELIYCSVPPDPVNGRVRYSSLEYGTELRYECDVGYMLQKHEPRLCSEDGSWSNEEPECIEAKCEAPPRPVHGSVKLHGELKVGSLATYSCDPGKKLHGAGTTKCLITGQWTFDAPQCLSSCSVPFVQNGDVGRIDIRTTGWNTREEFVKVYSGGEIDSNEVLILRCRDGFSPAEDSRIFEKNQLEVKCVDGTWSSSLQCYETACRGEPPSTPNGTPVISGRFHGHTIWYRCRTKDLVKVPGNVTCHFGSWIGIPPKCLNAPCYTKDLNYNGLVKPPQEYLEYYEGFDIRCEYGFRRADNLEKITCTRGRWDITQNPCIHDRGGDRFAVTTRPERIPPTREVPENAYVTPSNSHISDRDPECFCTYDFDSYSVKARVGGKLLKRGDNIPQGGTVSLECNNPSWILKWQNGFRFFGKINMTCNVCEKWQRKDLPVCSTTEDSDAVIVRQEDFRISPGGIVDLLRGGTPRFFCTSLWKQPQWDYGGRGVVYQGGTHSSKNGRVLFISYLDIVGVNDDHNGKYECYTLNDYGYRTGSSFLELRVKDVTCPWFISGGGLSITYSNDNKHQSWATFSCPANVRLIGEIHSFCQQNGMWSSTQPHCEVEDYVSCPRFPYSSELEVRYSNHMSVGSTATFRCLQSTKSLVGNSVSSCQEDGSWSSPLPSCEDPKCSIQDLSLSIPETIEPDMTGVNSEFVPSGSEILLKCSDNSILQGNSKVLCEGGRWKLGSSRRECVPGCVLNIDPSSHLLIQDEKPSYRLGEFVLLSCPPGEELSDDVERLMCIGGAWNPELPFCKESKNSHQP